MMSLTENNLLNVVRRQYLYKLRANAPVCVTLVMVQLVALLFSMMGTGGGTFVSSSKVAVNIRTFSSVGLLAFTFIWIFVTAIAFTTRNVRNGDFAFVSNRLSANLANICFLGTISVLAAVTAALGGVLVRNLIYWQVGINNILAANYFVDPGTLLMGAGVLSLYAFLLSGVGYLLGSLAQLNRALPVLLPAVIVGMFIMETNRADLNLFQRAVEVFTREPSLAVFALKVVVTVSVLYGLAVWITNKLEVRQ